MRKKFIIFDAEFTGLSKKDQLISLGAMTLDGDVFYGEISNFDKKLITEWINDNVIKNLLFNEVEAYSRDYEHEELKNTKIISYKLKFDDMCDKFTKWLNKVSDGCDKIQFVSDVGHYDIVHIFDLLAKGGSALDLDEKIIPAILDVNQFLELPIVAQQLSIDLKKDIPFNISREELYESLTGEGIDDSQVEEGKHNALYDANILLPIFVKCIEILGIEGE